MLIAVTGGAGFIGSHIVDALMRQGHSVVVIDNLSSGDLRHLEKWLNDPLFKFVRADLKNCSLESTFKGCEAVLHMAANPDVRISSVNPEKIYRENIYVTYRVLEASRKAGVKYFVFASSSTVYGEAKIKPTPEDYSPLEPISFYGASKLAGEAMVCSYAYTFGLKALSLRYANIIGSRSRHGVIYDFIVKLKKNPTRLEILGDGTQRKSYLHVSDCVEATLFLFDWLICEDVKYAVFNVGSEDWVTIREIADEVIMAMGLRNVYYMFTGGVDGGRGWKGDVKYMLLSIKKLKALGWKPKLNSRHAVRRAVYELLNETAN